MPHPLIELVEQSLSGQYAYWSEEGARKSAQLAVPGELLGANAWLLEGDIRALWSRWFLEGLCDPQRYVATDQNYAFFYHDILTAVESLNLSLPRDERVALARKLASIYWKEVEQQRLSIELKRSKRLKELFLWELDLNPRCWLCGYLFGPDARARFLGETMHDVDPALPVFVDYMRPRGMTHADMQIEIDHVRAFAGGGLHEDNLRLACGWCNRHKSDRSVIYDTSGTSHAYFIHPALGAISLPQPYWVIRVTAMRRRCEHPDGCPRRLESSELFVSTVRQGGAPVPNNLRLSCADHDPLAGQRLVSSAAFRRQK